MLWNQSLNGTNQSNSQHFYKGSKSTTKIFASSIYSRVVETLDFLFSCKILIFHGVFFLRGGFFFSPQACLIFCVLSFNPTSNLSGICINLFWEISNTCGNLSVLSCFYQCFHFEAVSLGAFWPALTWTGGLWAWYTASSRDAPPSSWAFLCLS